MTHHIRHILLCGLNRFDHGFIGETFEFLKSIVMFVVQVYFPVFYEIKVKNSIAQHIVTQLKLLREQNLLVQQAVEP